jgi:hypothetical protein
MKVDIGIKIAKIISDLHFPAHSMVKERLAQ